MLVSHLPCPCHQTSQSFALPLPPNQSVICLAPCHQTSQLFALPSTTTSPCHRITMLVSHLPCPLPPNQSVICLDPATKPVSHLTYPVPLHHCITAPLCHCITESPHHHISHSFALPLPPNQLVICLAPCHQTSQSFDLPSTTVSPHHRVSQSFALPPATKPVSHLTCPLPPRHHATASPR